MNSSARFLFLLGVCAIAVHGQNPAVPDGAVVNAASFSRNQPVAPGSLVSIFGSNLASSMAQADSIPLSTNLGGVAVTFNNIAAPMLFVNHNAANGDQINAQLPWEVQGASAQMVVTRAGTSSPPISVPLSTSVPGIFSVNFGTGQAIAYGNNDGAIAAAANAIPGLSTHPAKIGDPATLAILATGLGPVNPPVKTGNAVTDGQLHQTATKPEVLVGGVPANVVFSGMTPQFVGVYQVNIVISAGTPTGDAIPLQIRMNGYTTSDQITIAVSN